MGEKKEITYGKTFWQRVGSLFVKSLLGAVLGAIFVIFIGMVIDSVFLKILSQIVGVLCFIGMVYAGEWNDGDKDKNLVGFGRIKEDKLKGVKIGAVVMIPYILGGIILLLGLLGITVDLSAIYRVINFHIVILLNLVMDSAESSWEGLILGTIYYIVTVPIAGGIGYYLGYRRIAVLNKIMYGKNPTEKK